VLVAVWQHRKKASALDGGVDLSLKDSAGACQTCRDNFSIFGNKITQRVDIFVVNFFNPCSCKAAKTLALEKQ